MTRSIAPRLLGLLFIILGANHFLNPAPYLAMMPSYLPWPETLNFVSGAAEIAGGVGVILPATRALAAWGLIALLVAVFPANVQVALHGWPGESIPAWVLWARLPFQPLMIAGVYRICLGKRAEAP